MAVAQFSLSLHTLGATSPCLPLSMLKILCSGRGSILATASTLAMPHIFSLLVFCVRSAKVENIFHILRLLWEQQQQQQHQLHMRELSQLLLLLCLWRIRYMLRCRECNKMFCATLLSCFGTKFCTKYFCSLLLPSFGWICTFVSPPQPCLSPPPPLSSCVTRIRHVGDKR